MFANFYLRVDQSILLVAMSLAFLFCLFLFFVLEQIEMALEKARKKSTHTPTTVEYTKENKIDIIFQVFCFISLRARI